MQVDENHNRPTGDEMIDHAWVERQVFSLPLAELKRMLGRKRLRVDRGQIVAYLMALVAQQSLLRHYKAVHALDSCGVGYAGFMAGIALVAPLWVRLETRFRQEKGVGFDELTLADSSLLPGKEEGSIRSRDWDRKAVTVRPVSDGNGATRKLKVCGEKLLAVMNSQQQLVYCKLMPSINAADDHVFKNPMSWAIRGLRQGVLLVDRGFSNHEVRKGLTFLGKTLPNYTLRLVSPPRKSQKWCLSEADQRLYRKRWAIEEAFRQLKDSPGRFRLTMKGTRNPRIREARVAIATLAWNMEHA